MTGARSRLFGDVPEIVRRRMSRIRKTGSKPEVFVRQIAHQLGYRFRINRRGLPGTPDIVFPSRRKVIFVHGCFWHQHSGCKHATVPRQRTEYWLPKLARTIERDTENLKALTQLGWQSLVIWECQARSKPFIEQAIEEFLAPSRATPKG